MITLYPFTDSPILLAPSTSIISLDNPLYSQQTNYHDAVVLVNQNGDTLVNQNGDTLVGVVIRSTRTGVIDLGA